jgi:carbonic anhydrase
VIKNTKNSKAVSGVVIGAFFLLGTLGIANAVDEPWGYDFPKTLPADWGSLAGEELCGSGTAQSPIDFSQSKNTPKDMRVRRKNLRDIVYDYKETGLHLRNRGFDVQVLYDSGSTIQLTKKGPLFNLLQFHFHAPAEHTLEHGALFEMEIHLVHQSSADENQLAVVGLMFKEGQENAALKQLFEKLSQVPNGPMDEKPGDAYDNPDIKFNIAGALPSDRRYFAYHGSLTTPAGPNAGVEGCREVVEWRVIAQPIEMSREQIDTLIDVLDNSCCSINGNNRPTQAINGRKIFLDKKMKR